MTIWISKILSAYDNRQGIRISSLDGEFVPAGLLTMHQMGDDVASSFAYGRRYLERKYAVAVDPLQLPLGGHEYHFKGVFRAFQDCSPDGWGRHLLDRAAEVEGRLPTEFEYLTVLNQEDRVGASAFGLDLHGPQPFRPSWRPEEIPGDRPDLSDMMRNVDAILDFQDLPPKQRGSSAKSPPLKTQSLDAGILDWMQTMPGL